MLETDKTREYAAQWTDALYDKSPMELMEYLKANSVNRMFYIEFNYKQIGKDEAWYQKQCEMIDFDRIKIKRDICLQRIRGTNDSPFDPEDLDTINSLMRTCISEVLIRKIFSVRFYDKVNKDIPYIIGVDVSTGTNNDNTAISIIDPYKERAIGEFKSPLMNVIDICTFLRLLIKNYLPKGILCIERNSLGDAVIEMLKHTETGPHLYYDSDTFIIGNPDEKLDDHGFIKRQAENRKSYGVYTNTKSRELMMAIMMRLVQEKKEAFATKFIIEDLNNLIKKASGKIEARSGAHDDNIMSFLIGMYILYHGKKLHKWGFIRGGTPIDSKTLQPIKYEDVYNEMDDDMKQTFPEPPPQHDPYQELIRKEIMKTQQQRNNFSYTDGVIVRRDDEALIENNMDKDYTDYLNGGGEYTDADDEFFKDINS